MKANFQRQGKGSDSVSVHDAGQRKEINAFQHMLGRAKLGVAAGAIAAFTILGPQVDSIRMPVNARPAIAWHFGKKAFAENEQITKENAQKWLKAPMEEYESILFGSLILGYYDPKGANMPDVGEALGKFMKEQKLSKETRSIAIPVSDEVLVLALVQPGTSIVKIVAAGFDKNGQFGTKVTDFETDKIFSDELQIVSNKGKSTDHVALSIFDEKSGMLWLAEWHGIKMDGYNLFEMGKVPKGFKVQALPNRDYVMVQTLDGIGFFKSNDKAELKLLTEVPK